MNLARGVWDEGHGRMEGFEWLDEVQRRNEAAMDMVVALCLPRGAPGAREWLMSIPARLDYDPDLVISESLKDIPRLCRAVQELAGALERLVAADDRVELVDGAIAYFGGKRSEDMRTVAASARGNARAVLERWKSGGD